ncbi:MAG TPA: hypothetical protein VKZ62_00250 [Georgenia sp.]|nr:hypothetical protein [Paenibacillus bovis]HLT85912.1 hypothetical protein [Georgenia sp.]
MIAVQQRKNSKSEDGILTYNTMRTTSQLSSIENRRKQRNKDLTNAMITHQIKERWSSRQREMELLIKLSETEEKLYKLQLKFDKLEYEKKALEKSVQTLKETLHKTKEKLINYDKVMTQYQNLVQYFKLNFTKITR